MDSNQDVYVRIEHYLNRLNNQLTGLAYKGVPAFGIVKIPIYSVLRNRYLSANQGFLRRSIKECIGILIQVLRLLLWKNSKIEHISYSNRDDVIFLIDHNVSSFIQMQESVLNKFDPNSVMIITENEHLYNRFKNTYAGRVFYAERFVQASAPTMFHFRAAYQLLQRFKVSGSDGLTLKLNGALAFIRGMRLIDSYGRFLTCDSHKAVVTLNDVQFHEYLITNVANQKGISTFTLQHGIVDALHTPVSSDRIFVWGDATKRELIKYKVIDHKVVVSGRPGLDNILREYANRSQNIKREFLEKYNEVRDRLIVTLIAGLRGPTEERELLRCFLSIRKQDVFLVVKLKSGAEVSQTKEYLGWISEFSKGDKVCVFINEDLYEILAVTDILATFASSVAVEALPFSVICILLDLFKNIDLRNSVPHYDDCQVVHNEREFQELIYRIMTDRHYFSLLKEESYKNSKKHFANSVETSASQFIHDYIMDFKKT